MAQMVDTIPRFLGGHPAIITRSVRITDADNGQTNLALTPAIAAGTRVYLTMIDVQSTAAVAVLIGFGATAVPTPALAGADGIVVDIPSVPTGFPGLKKGDGSAVIAVGASGEELRATVPDPTGGAVTITFSYFASTQT